MHVYAIQNKINDKIYIGQTYQNLDRYLRSDVTRATLNNGDRKPYLYNAIRKYGEEAFTIKLLADVVDKAQADKLEQFFIRTFETQDKNIGYNIANGGGGSFGYKKSPISEETRKKMSEASKGRTHSLEERIKMSVAMKGIPKSYEHRRKLSESKLGKKIGPFSEETRKKMSSAWMGHTVSEETRRKISESNKAYQLRKKLDRRLNGTS